VGGGGGLEGYVERGSMRLGELLKTYPLVACDIFLVNKFKFLALVYLLSRILL
jgi:hypothetical protein